MLFIDNKYTNIYNKIIDQAKLRSITGYTEKHHIIPKSFGGSNDQINIVNLTAREHFLCHLLLTKMTTGEYKKKMVFAVFKLLGKGKRDRANVINSRIYENLKIELSNIVSHQKRGCKQPPRTAKAKLKYSMSKKGKLNPNFKYEWITPWGTFDSSRLAASMCPEKISSVTILNFCQKKNKSPISFLSVCRSKGWLKEDHVGKTPIDLGFSVNTTAR